VREQAGVGRADPILAERGVDAGEGRFVEQAGGAQQELGGAGGDGGADGVERVGHAAG
jgi:hypothetical protein